MTLEIISRKEAKARGLNKYFTGEPCVHGHIAERRTSYTMCVECDRIRQTKPALKAKVAVWRRQNKEAIDKNKDDYRARRREYLAAKVKENFEANKGRILAWRAAYRKNNKPKIKAARIRYHAENPQRVVESKRLDYDRHSNRYKEKSKLWAKENPEKARLAGKTRRARKLGAAGTFTPEDVAEIRKLQRNKCAYCRVSLSKAIVHIDHIVSLSRGGSNHRRNLQLLCQPCNNRKHAKDPIVFARQLGKLL